MIHAILFMNAITPVHNGAGEGLGLIDRPILRERITNFPVIQGSSLKGVLKDVYRPPKLKDDELDIIFGPDDGEKHASAMAFGDGNILCFPIRSLSGGFVWATSPLVFRRFLQVIEIASLDNKFKEIKKAG
jgi:CRISPR-associated protein Cmr4